MGHPAHAQRGAAKKFPNGCGVLSGQVARIHERARAPLRGQEHIWDFRPGAFGTRTGAYAFVTAVETVSANLKQVVGEIVPAHPMLQASFPLKPGRAYRARRASIGTSRTGAARFRRIDRHLPSSITGAYRRHEKRSDKAGRPVGMADEQAGSADKPQSCGKRELFFRLIGVYAYAKLIFRKRMLAAQRTGENLEYSNHGRIMITRRERANPQGAAPIYPEFSGAFGQFRRNRIIREKNDQGSGLRRLLSVAKTIRLYAALKKQGIERLHDGSYWWESLRERSIFCILR